MRGDPRSRLSNPNESLAFGDICKQYLNCNFTDSGVEEHDSATRDTVSNAQFPELNSVGPPYMYSAGEAVADCEDRGAAEAGARRHG